MNRLLVYLKSASVANALIGSLWESYVILYDTMDTLWRLFFVLMSVLLLHLTNGDRENISSSSQFLRYKRESPPNSEPEHNPCNYKPLEKPNFDTPGRRISESKCQEYLWEIEKREYNYKKEFECAEYRYQQSKFVQRPSAVGGRDTEPGEFPHMGAVGWRVTNGTWIFLCGSSLISSKFMLTAAHCSKISSRYPNIANTTPEIVRLGDKNIADVFLPGKPVTDAKIQRIIVHPEYSSPKKYFDIAIIELQNDVFISRYIQPACLWTKFDTSPLGTKATLTGWGVIETATLKTSPELQAAEIDILDSNICDDTLKPNTRSKLWSGMAETQICAGKLSGGVDACQGDSGGPLQVKINLTSTTFGSMNYLIGITSFGKGCARVNTPAVYTRISSFIDWIEDVVWPSKT